MLSCAEYGRQDPKCVISPIFFLIFYLNVEVISKKKKKLVQTYLFANVVGSTTTAFNIPKKLPQIKGKIMIFNEFSFLKYENKITKFEICATTKIY